MNNNDALKLGNDPFQRGAARRTPDSSTEEKTASSPQKNRPVKKRKTADAEQSGEIRSGNNKKTPAKMDMKKTQKRSPDKKVIKSRKSADKTNAGKKRKRPLKTAEKSSAKILEKKQIHSTDRVKPASVPSEAGDIQNSLVGPINKNGHALKSGIDDLGLDFEIEKKWRPFFEFIYRKWFRVEVSGMENIPSSGPAILVCNHGGFLPWDALMLKTAIEMAGPRQVRPLLDNFFFHFPYIGTFLNRYGGVRACQENAEHILREGNLAVAFPEGLMGLGKTRKSRHRLLRFGRGGFIKLALRTGAPIIPVAICGSEDAHPVLFNFSHIGQQFGIPYLPVTPTFPLLGLFGLLPFPVKWHIEICEPVDLKRFGHAAVSDRVLINRLSDEVRFTIQSHIDRLAELPKQN